MSKLTFTRSRKSSGKIVWRWTLTARNGRITDASTEDYSSKQGAVRNLVTIKAALEDIDLSGQSGRTP